MLLTQFLFILLFQIRTKKYARNIGSTLYIIKKKILGDIFHFKVFMNLARSTAQTMRTFQQV